MSEMIERVASVLSQTLPTIHTRYNDWTSDRVPGLPVEVFRYGEEGEHEIVIVRRFPATISENDAMIAVLSETMGRHAILAMRELTDEMFAAAVVVPHEDGVSALWKAMIDEALR